MAVKVELKNMKMPKNCDECKFAKYSYFGTTCVLDEDVFIADSEGPLEERPKYCPLKEIK